MTRFSKYALLALSFILSFYSSAAYATSINCTLKAMPENFESADLVISGTVVSQSDIPLNIKHHPIMEPNVDSVFKVLEVWKGDVSDTVNISSQRPNGMNFGSSFAQGGSYLVFAHKLKDGSYTSQINACNYTMSLDKAEQYIKDLEHFKATQQHYPPTCKSSSFEDKLDNAELVALGTVEAAEEVDTPDSLFDGKILFRPTKIWKGKAPESFWVLTLGKQWHTRNFYKGITINLRSTTSSRAYLLLFAKRSKLENSGVPYEQSDCWGLFRLGDQPIARSSPDRNPYDLVRKHFGESIPDCNGETNVYTAIRHNHPNLQCLFASAEKSPPSEQWLKEAMQIAVAACHVDATKKLISLGAPINEAYLMISAINCACSPVSREQTTEIAELLHKTGFDINDKSLQLKNGTSHVDYIKERMKDYALQTKKDGITYVDNRASEPTAVRAASALKNLSSLLIRLQKPETDKTRQSTKQ